MPRTNAPSTTSGEDPKAQHSEQQGLWWKSVQPVAGERLPEVDDRTAAMAVWHQSAGSQSHIGSANAKPDRQHADDGSIVVQPALSGISGAAGRDQYVGGQIAQAERKVRAQPAVRFDGELYRSVSLQFTNTFSNHAFSDPGRYNAPGQSALYTATSLDAVKVEAGNYGGLNGKAVVRSSFQGDLLDLRATPGVQRGALTEGYGQEGRMQSRLSRLTGEDPYAIPRAVADVVRERGLSGVIAPANTSTTHVALFPDDPNAASSGPGRLQAGLQGLDYTHVDAHAPAVTVSFGRPPQNIPDTTPNRYSPAVLNGTNPPSQGPHSYPEAVALETEQHSRAGGARYGALGAGAVSLVEGVANGSIDGKKVAIDTGLGAASAQTETMLARRADRLLGGSVMPPRVATGATAALEGNVGSALRPPSLIAGAGAAGVVGAVVGGGLTAWHDAAEVKSGRMTAGRATADVAVQTGIGLGSGVAGAAVGAAFGSVVPVFGTAAGAVAGFGVGIGASWIAQHSEAIRDAQKEAGDYLTARFERPLQQAWRPVSATADAAHSVTRAGLQLVTRAEDAYVEPRQLMGTGSAQLAARGEHAAQDILKRLKGPDGDTASAFGARLTLHPPVVPQASALAAEHARVEVDRAVWNRSVADPAARLHGPAVPVTTAHPGYDAPLGRTDMTTHQAVSKAGIIQSNVAQPAAQAEPSKLGLQR